MQPERNDILSFLLITTIIILLLTGLIIMLFYLYQNKQIAYRKKLENLKLDHEKSLMATQLEIQENTFQHISREIHDNINLSLTLAKLQLNTLDWHEREKNICQVNSSIELISQAIDNLSDISKSLNSDIIGSQGLITAIENEISKIKETGLFTISLQVTGNAVYMDIQKELIIFRILQEAFNNILKHSNASDARVVLHYNEAGLDISIRDNGKGFILPDFAEINKSGRAGLKNMETRSKAIEGKMQIETNPGLGTNLLFYIPY